MPVPYAVARQSLRSGDILAFRGTGPLDQNSDDQPTGLYTHVALIWVIGQRVLLLEVLKGQGVVISFASNRIAGVHCDIVRTNTNWTSALESYALKCAGLGASFLNAQLKASGVDPSKGEISSLFVGDVLRTAGTHLMMKGLYTQILVDDLLELGYQIQRLSKTDLDIGSIASIIFNDSKGNSMSSATLPRDQQAAGSLTFKTADGSVVAAPADLALVSSDTSIVTVALTGADFVLTPAGAGSATITATTGTVSAALGVSVTEAGITEIDFSDLTFSPIAGSGAPVVPVAPVDDAAAAAAANAQ